MQKNQTKLDELQARASELRISQNDAKTCVDLGEKIDTYLHELIKNEPAIGSKLLREEQGVDIQKNSDGFPIGYTRHRAIFPSQKTVDHGLDNLISKVVSQAKKDCLNRK